jgi:hypothetical protein
MDFSHFPDSFKPRWKYLYLRFFCSFVSLGLGIGYLVQGNRDAAGEFFLLMLGSYLLFAYLGFYDLSTRFVREDKLIRKTSWLPFLNKTYNLKGATSYSFHQTLYTSDLYIYGKNWEVLGKFPIGAFRFEPLQEWATNNLKVLKLTADPDQQ